MKNKTVIINTEKGKKKYTVKKGQEMIAPLDRNYIFHSSQRASLEQQLNSVEGLFKKGKDSVNKELFNDSLNACLHAMMKSIAEALHVVTLKMEIRLLTILPKLEGRVILFTHDGNHMKIDEEDKRWTKKYREEELEILTRGHKMLSRVSAMNLPTDEKMKICEATDKASVMELKMHRDRGRKLNGKKGELDGFELDSALDSIEEASAILEMLKEGEGGIA